MNGYSRHVVLRDCNTKAMFVMCLEATLEHVMDSNLMSKGRIIQLCCFLALAKVVVLIMEMCGDAVDLDIELVNFLMSAKEPEVRVH
jgi:hypothetical protein